MSLNLPTPSCSLLPLPPSGARAHGGPLPRGEEAILLGSRGEGEAQPPPLLSPPPFLSSAPQSLCPAAKEAFKAGEARRIFEAVQANPGEPRGESVQDRKQA